MAFVLARGLLQVLVERAEHLVLWLPISAVSYQGAVNL